MTRTRLLQIAIFSLISAAVPGDATTGRCLKLVDRSLNIANGIAVSGSRDGTVGAYAYVGAVEVFKVVDISEPAAPAVVGSLALPEFITTIVARHEFAYVWTYDATLHVIDVSDPRDPCEVGSLDDQGSLGYVVARVSGSYAFVSFSSLIGGSSPVRRIRVIDLGDPSAPLEIATLEGDFGSLAISGSLLYALSSSQAETGWELEVIDVSDAEEPIKLGSYQAAAGDAAYDVVAEGSVAYVSTSSGLAAIDASDPSSPFEAGLIDLPHSRTLALADGHLYAVVNSQFDVIDVSDPSKPISEGSCRLPYTYVVPSELVVHNDHVLISHSYQGVVVIDVSLPSEPLMVRRLSEGWPYDVEISGNYAYWIHRMWPGPWRMRISDISRPGKPIDVGYFETDHTLKSVTVSGSIAYVAADAAGLLMIDVSDPTDPREINSFGPWYQLAGVEVQNSRAYLLRSAGVRELVILNVSDPYDLHHIGGCKLPQLGSPRGLAVRGDHAFITTESTLTVIDVSDTWRPREVAHLEVPAGPIVLSRSYAYLAAGAAGLRVLDIGEPSAPHEVGHLALTSWISGEPLEAISVAVSRRLAYIVTKDDGLHVVDVSDPSEPHELRFIAEGSAIDAAIGGSYALLASGHAGSCVIDISGCADRRSPDRGGRRPDHRGPK